MAHSGAMQPNRQWRTVFECVTVLLNVDIAKVSDFMIFSVITDMLTYTHKEKKQSRTNNQDLLPPDSSSSATATSEAQQTQALTQPLPSSLDLTPPDTQWDEDHHLNVADYLDFGSVAGDETRLINPYATSSTSSLGQGRELDDNRAAIMDVLTSLANGDGGELSIPTIIYLLRLYDGCRGPDLTRGYKDSWLGSHHMSLLTGPTAAATAAQAEGRDFGTLSSTSLSRPGTATTGSNNATQLLPATASLATTSAMPQSRPRPRQHQRSMSDQQHATSLPVPSAVRDKKQSQATQPRSGTGSSVGNTDSTESLESRFERLLGMIEEAGFDSIDSMVTTYYTAQFSNQSIMHPMQAASRTRRLRTLLTALQADQLSWTEREKYAYSEEVTRAAEQIYSAEIREQHSSPTRGGRRESTTSYRSSDEQATEQQQQSSMHEGVAHKIIEILSGPDAVDVLHRERCALQSRVRMT